MKKKKHAFLAIAAMLAACVGLVAQTGATVTGAADGITYNEMQTVETGIINPATTLMEIKSSADLSKAVSAKVNVALVRTDGTNVLAEDGSTICAVSAIADSLRTGTLVAFSVETEDALNALSSYLDTTGADSYIVTKDPALLKKARKKYTLALGVLDLRDSENLTADEIVKKVNEGYSKIAILDGENCNVDFVNSLRKRYVTVWAQDLSATKKSAVSTVLTGVNGVLTDNVSVYNDVYGEVFSKNKSVVRESFIIGHRGSSATYGGYSPYGPENSLISAQRAYYDGADYVEIDVQFTSDKEMVIMHDATLGTMLNATGVVGTKTLAEIKSYTYKNFEDEDYRVPTLEEMIDYFKTTDCMLVIELKDYSENMAKAVVELVREKSFENQCVIICFSKQSLEYCYKYAPEISCGALESTDHRKYERVYDEKHDVYKNGDLIVGDTLQSLISGVNAFNCAYNPGYNVIAEEMVQQLQLRGIGTQVWTLTNAALLDTYMMQGCSSLTVDGVALLDGRIRNISTDQQSYSVKVGKTADIKVQGNYYARSDYDGNAVAPMDITENNFTVPIIVDGDSFEEVDGNLQAVKAGETTVVYRYKTFSASGEYYVYSQPITLTATATEGGCGSVSMSIPCVSIVSSLGLAIYMKKKEKKL